MKKLLPLLFCFILLFASCSPDNPGANQNPNENYTTLEVATAVKDALAYNHTMMNPQSSTTTASRAIGSETIIDMYMNMMSDQDFYKKYIDDMAAKVTSGQTSITGDLSYNTADYEKSYGNLTMSFKNFTPMSNNGKVTADSLSIAFDDGANRVSLEESNVDITITQSDYSATATITLTDTRKHASGSLVSFTVSESMNFTNMSYSITLENLTYKGVAITNVSEIQDYIIQVMTGSSSNPGTSDPGTSTPGASTPGASLAEAAALKVLNALASPSDYQASGTSKTTTATVEIDTSNVANNNGSYQKTTTPIALELSTNGNTLDATMTGVLEVYYQDAKLADVTLDGFTFTVDVSTAGEGTEPTVTTDGFGYTFEPVANPSISYEMSATEFAEYATTFLQYIDNDQASSYGVTVSNRIDSTECELTGFNVDGYNEASLTITKGVTFELSVTSTSSEQPPMTMKFTTSESRGEITSFTIERAGSSVSFDSISDEIKSAAITFAKNF